jgi:hypothetical protein
MSPWAWPTKVVLFTSFRWPPGQRGCTSGRSHTNTHKTAWDTHLALGGPVMFCSCSRPFSLLPSCLPVVPPGIVQATGSLGHHWVPMGVLWIKLSIGTWQDHFSWWYRICTSAAREVKKNIVSESQTSSQTCCRILNDRETEHWGSSAGSNILLCWCRLSGLVSKGWALRTKGAYLIHPCK